jgi:cysteine synthase A
MIASSVLDLMGNTPLVRLHGREISKPRAQLWGKLELTMPGAMKDRAALQMVCDAEKAGLLRPGGIIAESSSGTLAEGLARVGTIKGYRVIIVSDPRLDPGSIAKLTALGAEVIIVKECHPHGGWQRSRLEVLKGVLSRHPNALWPCQYDSPSNAGAYERTTARELVDALGPKIAAIVATVGSGGSLCGAARSLRKSFPDIRVVAVDAVGSVQFHQPHRTRLQSGHGNGILPGSVDFNIIDEVHWIADGEAFNACRELARREGIFAGGSSGAAYIVSSWIAEQFQADDHVVTLLPDRGERYANTIYSDAYMAEKGLLGVHAPSQPKTIRYGVDVAETWSRAELPHDGSVSYVAEDTVRSGALARELQISAEQSGAKCTSHS